MPNFVQGLLNTAVQASPYVYQAVQQREAKQKADLASQLAALHQQSDDNTKSVAANIAAGVGLSNIRHIDAETKKLGEPTQKVMRGPGGQLVAYSDDDPTKATNIGPAPIPKAPAAEPIVPIVGPDGKRIYSTRTAAIGKEAPAPNAPPDNVLVPIQNADGTVTYAKRADAAGKETPTKAGGAGGGGMGSGGIGGLARTSGAITEMDQAHQNMLPFESAVKSGKANYNGLDYFQGQMAKMYDAHGKIDQAIHTAAFSNLDKNNPDLANYLRNAEAWALADGALSGKTSDFRTRMDAFVSAIGPSAGATHIDQTQRMRGTRLAEVQKFQPAMQAMAQRVVGNAQGRGRGGPATASPSQGPESTPGPINLGKITPAERAALKSQGFSDAQITAKYGPP